MSISLPETMRDFIDDQVATRGFSSTSEYLRDLIRREQDRQDLRALLLEGANSEPGPPADKAYFDSLRARIGKPDKGLPNP